jgi:hypothetical protein
VSPLPGADPPPAAPAEERPPADGGRDERGRFTKDNRFGPGNPFARRTAAFRRAIAAAVTEEMIAAVIGKLAERALAGDVAAIKQFLAYTVGKPGPAVNPDTLDLEELRQYEQELLPGPTLGAIMTSPSPEVFLESARIMRPQLGDECMKKVLQGIDDLDAAEREDAAAIEEDAAEQPEENGAPTDAGSAAGCVEQSRPARRGNGKSDKPAPSGNGDIGGCRPGAKRQEGPGRDNRNGGRPRGREEPGSAEQQKRP